MKIGHGTDGYHAQTNDEDRSRCSGDILEDRKQTGRQTNKRCILAGGYNTVDVGWNNMLHVAVYRYRPTACAK